MGHLGMSHFPSWLLPAPQQPGHSTFICPSPPTPKDDWNPNPKFFVGTLGKNEIRRVHFLVPLKNIGKGFKFCRLLWIINPNPLIQKPRSLEHSAISQFSNYTQVEAETRKLKLVYEIKCCIKKKPFITSRFIRRNTIDLLTNYLFNPEIEVWPSNPCSRTRCLRVLRLPISSAISCLNSLCYGFPFQFRWFTIHNKYQLDSETSQIQQSKEEVSQMRFVDIFFQTFSTLRLAYPTA